MEQYLQPFIKTDNIFLFVPNVIGYARLGFLLLACLFMTSFPTPTLLFYFLSASLDAFDGLAARKYKQETRFGQLLDQLTDRCSTLCLVMGLAYLYPGFFLFFQLAAVIDIAGHWIHTQVSLMTGNTSHKVIESKPTGVQSSIQYIVYNLIKIYYSNRIVLFGLCLANEVFYVTLYMLYFYEGFASKFLRPNFFEH